LFPVTLTLKEADRLRAKHLTLIILTVLTCGMLGTALAHSGATGIVKERMDLFKRNKDNLKAIKAHIGDGNVDAIIPLADEIRDWAARMPDYFPAGSDQKPSEAAPAIWSDFDGFKKAAEDNQRAAEMLVVAAKSGDMDTVISGFKSVAATCKSCHNAFKLD
jgi:cytochrome c556